VQPEKITEFGAHYWSWAMEPVIRRLRIQTLKGQVVLCQLRHASLAKRCDSETLSDGQKAEIFRRRVESLNECHALQVMVDLMEREEKDEREKLD
jgi:predicted amino acid dehydrogenase